MDLSFYHRHGSSRSRLTWLRVLEDVETVTESGERVAKLVRKNRQEAVPTECAVFLSRLVRLENCMHTLLKLTVSHGVTDW